MLVFRCTKKSESVIYTHISLPFPIVFPYRLLHRIVQITLGYTVSPCYLSILYAAGCICWSQLPSLLHPSFHIFPLVAINLFSKSLKKRSCFTNITEGQLPSLGFFVIPHRPSPLGPERSPPAVLGVLPGITQKDQLPHNSPLQRKKDYPFWTAKQKFWTGFSLAQNLWLFPEPKGLWLS